MSSDNYQAQLGHEYDWIDRRDSESDFIDFELEPSLDEHRFNEREVWRLAVMDWNRFDDLSRQIYNQIQQYVRKL